MSPPSEIPSKFRTMSRRKVSAGCSRSTAEADGDSEKHNAKLRPPQGLTGSQVHLTTSSTCVATIKRDSTSEGSISVRFGPWPPKILVASPVV